MEARTGDEPCPGCRLGLPLQEGERHAYLGASAACWRLYGTLLEREYSDPDYMAVHRTTVDAYAAQHPGSPEPRTIQSINVHLTGLYLVLERGLDARFVRKVSGALTRDKRRLQWLEPPPDLGAMTVQDVLRATSAPDHRRRVEDWGRLVWQAWSSAHELVAALAQSAIAGLR